MQSLSPSTPTGPTAKSIGSSAAITQPTPPPTNEVRHHLLPSDVKKRYDDQHQDPNIIVPIQNLVPFVATSARPPPCNFFHFPIFLRSMETFPAVVKYASIAILCPTRSSPCRPESTATSRRLALTNHFWVRTSAETNEMGFVRRRGPEAKTTSSATQNDTAP